MARCSSLTRSGLRCKKSATPGTDACPTHSSDGNKAKGAPRPSPLDDGKIGKTLERLRHGLCSTMTEAGAAKAAGVHRATLSGWLKQGRLDAAAEPPVESPFRQVLETIDEARDELIAEIGAQLQSEAMAQRDTRMLLRILERLDPDNWSERREVRHGGSDTAPPIATTGPPPVVVSVVTFDQALDADVDDALAG